MLSNNERTILIAKHLHAVTSFHATKDGVDIWVKGADGSEVYLGFLNYAKNWVDMGPVIDKYGISIGRNSKNIAWAGSHNGKVIKFESSVLEAAVLCFIASEIDN